MSHAGTSGGDDKCVHIIVVNASGRKGVTRAQLNKDLKGMYEAARGTPCLMYVTEFPSSYLHAGGQPKGNTKETGFPHTRVLSKREQGSGVKTSYIGATGTVERATGTVEPVELEDLQGEDLLYVKKELLKIHEKVATGVDPIEADGVAEFDVGGHQLSSRIVVGWATGLTPDKKVLVATMHGFHRTGFGKTSKVKEQKRAIVRRVCVMLSTIVNENESTCSGCVFAGDFNTDIEASDLGQFRKANVKKNKKDKHIDHVLVMGKLELSEANSTTFKPTALDHPLLDLELKVTQ